MRLWQLNSHDNECIFTIPCLVHPEAWHGALRNGINTVEKEYQFVIIAGRQQSVPCIYSNIWPKTGHLPERVTSLDFTESALADWKAQKSIELRGNNQPTDQLD